MSDCPWSRSQESCADGSRIAPHEGGSLVPRSANSMARHSFI